MSSRTIILIRDRDNPDRMELAEFSDPHEAERYLEQLIEDGVPEDAVRAFTAVELNMQVSHKPVVSLGGQTPAGANEGEAAPVAANSQIATDGQPDSGGAEATGEAEGPREQPFVRDGVRFSELFKPAGG